MHAAGFDYTKISIDIYILADAVDLFTFEWTTILSVGRMIATHSSNVTSYTRSHHVQRVDLNASSGWEQGLSHTLYSFLCQVLAGDVHDQRPVVDELSLHRHPSRRVSLL